MCFQRAEILRGLHEASPRPDRQTDLPQIIFGEIWQIREFDLILGKGWVVSFEA